MANTNSSTGTGFLDSPNIAPLGNFSEWVGGFVDDVDLEIVKARLVPWNWYNTTDTFSLFVRLWFRPIGDAEGAMDPFDQVYNVAHLDGWCPTNDGTTPAGLSAEDYKALSKGETSIDLVEDGQFLHAPEQYQGVALLKIGTRATPDPNSNFRQFLAELAEAGFPREEMVGDVRFLEGLKGHFNQVPQKGRKKAGGAATDTAGQAGQAAADDGTKKYTVLVCTHVYERPAQKGKASSAGKAAGSTTAGTAGGISKANGSVQSTSGAGDFASEVEELVLGLVAEKPLSWTDLRKELLKAVDKSKHAQLVKLMNGRDLKDGRSYVYDADRNLVGLDQESIDAAATG